MSGRGFLAVRGWSSPFFESNAHIYINVGNYKKIMNIAI